jgi:hypothetical protein
MQVERTPNVMLRLGTWLSEDWRMQSHQKFYHSETASFPRDVFQRLLRFSEVLSLQKSIVKGVFLGPAVGGSLRAIQCSSPVCGPDISSH